MEKRLNVRLLGGFSLVYNDSAITSIQSARLRSAFTYLLLHREASSPRRLISFAFWPDSKETQARTNLRKLIYDFRHAFPQIDDLMILNSKIIRWREDVSIRTDVEDFECIAEQAKTAEELKVAVDLYRGELLPACYEEWILSERQRLHDLFVETIERLTELLESQREYLSAIRYTQHLLQYVPLKENVYRRLMRLYGLSGDRAGVVHTFHECATILQRELEIEPSKLTRDEYERLLNLEKPPLQLPDTSEELPERVSEWARLQEAWRKVMAGAAQWVVLSGPKGSGKTRLAEEMVRWARQQGFATATARCYPGEERLAYAPIKSLLRLRKLPPLNKVWLSELVRILPEILEEHPDLAPPGPLQETWQKHRFFEAIDGILLDNQPVFLFIDDLQWCDRDTLDWLSYLAHFHADARLFILCTVCMHDRDDDSPVASLFPYLVEHGDLTEIPLE